MSIVNVIILVFSVIKYIVLNFLLFINNPSQ